MAKIKLNPNPTFHAPVEIHVPGEQPVKVTFEFKHRDRHGLKSFSDTIRDLEDAEIVKLACVGWELDEPFNDANIQLLLDNYIGAAGSIVSTYYRELVAAKQGN